MATATMVIHFRLSRPRPEWHSCYNAAITKRRSALFSKLKPIPFLYRVLGPAGLARLAGPFRVRPARLPGRVRQSIMAESHVMTANAADRVAPLGTVSPTIEAEAGAIERELRAAGKPGRADREKAYLKSDLEFAGTPTADIRSVAKAWSSARPGLAHDDLLEVTAALWARPVFECRAAAVELLRHRLALLRAGDAAQLEAMLRTSHTWALVDSLAEHVMGGLTEAFPQLTATLDRWAGDEDFWVRRSALLALLGPLRRGGGDFGRFGRYADTMLTEREFFIRKAIGWVLRDTARRRPEMVAQWLAPRIHLASGITVREAVKPLAPGTREMLMAGYRGKYPVALAPPH